MANNEPMRSLTYTTCIMFCMIKLHNWLLSHEIVSFSTKICIKDDNWIYVFLTFDYILTKYECDDSQNINYKKES